MKLHLPSRLRRAVLACLAPVLTLASSASWCAALLPSGALCLFAAGQTQGKEHTVNKGGTWVVDTDNSVTLEGGGASDKIDYVSSDDFIFDAPGTLEEPLIVYLNMRSPFTVNNVIVEEGTNVIVSGYNSETNNFSYEGKLTVNGSIEFTAINRNKLNLGTNGSGKLHDIEGTGRISLNFSNRNSHVNGCCGRHLSMVCQRT